VETDGRLLLDLIGDLYGVLDIEEFRVDLLAALSRVIPCDWISLNDIGPEPGDATVLVEPRFSPEDHELFARFAHENPLIVRYRETLDGRACRFSDVVTSAELHELALYREFYASIGLEHQIAFTLPGKPNRLLGLALSRRDCDFTDAERALLNDGRPFLIQAYRNSIEHAQLRSGATVDPRRSPVESLTAVLADKGLTPRESATLAIVATGRSDAAAASLLGISRRTVQKHLERSYRKLGVSGRSDAATVAWSLLAESVEAVAAVTADAGS